MRKYLAPIAAFFAFLPMVMMAQIEEGDLPLQEIKPQSNQGPFSASASYDATGKSKVTKHRYDDEHVAFDLANVTGSFIFYYDKKHREGALVSLGYTYARLDWTHNPFFKEKDFQTLNVSIGGFTYRACDWFWKGLFTANINTKEWGCDFSNYDLSLWGRYTYSEAIGLHAGLIVQTGMKMDRVYPIFGFDWTINDDWKWKMVFPVDMALVYSFAKNWSADLAIRLFDYRNRVDSRGSLPYAVFRYQSGGAEFGVTYDDDSFISANIHAGVIVGGHLRVANRHNQHSKRFHVGSAPYAGGSVAVKF